MKELNYGDIKINAFIIHACQSHDTVWNQERNIYKFDINVHEWWTISLLRPT
jgi:hypothetical protein